VGRPYVFHTHRCFSLVYPYTHPSPARWPLLSDADLLLDGATDANKQVFNILCEQPETVAAYLVPRVRTVVARGNGGRYIKYLTLPRALARFITAPLRANRYFDRQGELKALPVPDLRSQPDSREEVRLRVLYDVSGYPNFVP